MKLVNFGEAMVFDSKARMLTTKSLRGGTIPYLPPEVVKNRKGEPIAIDVYCWGITLYSLLAGLTYDQLCDDEELRKNDYNGFLDKVSKLKAKNDTDGRVSKKAVRILDNALSFDPKKRPTFNKLLNEVESPEFYRNRINRMNKELQKSIKERSRINCNSRRL